MFETIIASFIKRYLIRYIDINADQLSAQLLSKQQIIIDNLRFNITAINEDIRKKFHLPLTIESIDLGQIQCSFVWSSLFFRSTSAAFIIKIQRIHLVVKSYEEETSSETDDETNEKYKRDQLDLAEQQFEKEWECFGEVKRSRWNVQHLIMSFFEKLQIHIHDVHIQYKTSSDQSIGLTCHQIDIGNEPCNELMSRQVIRINQPGLYINTNLVSDHSYILFLESSMAISLTHNHFLVSQQEYRYEFECVLNHFDIKCTAEQIRLLVEILRSIQYSSLYRMIMFDPCRPRSKVSKQSVRIWWRYAILAVLRLRMAVKDSTTSLWFDRSLLINRLHRLNTYARLYRTHLSKSSSLSIEVQQTLSEIEKEFDLEHLLIMRRSIFQSRINEQISQRRKVTPWYANYAQWITSRMIDLWGRTSTNSEVSLNENDVKIQDQVNTFIAESLEDEDLLESCQNAQIFRFNLVLKSIQINLLSSQHAELLGFHLQNFTWLTEVRPRHRALMLAIRLDDLLVRDQEQTETFSAIISANKEVQHQQSSVLDFVFEKRAKMPSSICFRSCGLSIVCCPTSIQRLYRFYVSALDEPSLSIPLSLTYCKRIQHCIARNYRSILEQTVTTSKVRSLKRRHHFAKKILQISVNIGASKIIMPFSSQDSVIVGISCLSFTNVPRNAASVDEEEFLTPVSSPSANDELFEVESTFYSMNFFTADQTSDAVDQSPFKFSIDNVQIGYPACLTQIVQLSNLCFSLQPQNDRLWPIVNISGVFQKVNLCFDLHQIQNLSNALTPWLTLLTCASSQQHYQRSILPGFDCRFEEICVVLNDNSQTLCDIRMCNAYVTFTKNQHLNSMTLSLEDLIIYDCLAKTENGNEILLKVERVSSNSDAFIRVNSHFQTTPTISNINAIVDVNTNKLIFVFNPRTFCTLLNYFSTINRSRITKDTLSKHLENCQLNIKSTQTNIIFHPFTTAKWSNEIKMDRFALNVTFNTYTRCEMMISSLQLLNHSDNLPAINIRDHSNQCEAPSLYCLLTNEKNKQFHLLIKVSSFSYKHSQYLIESVRETYDDIKRNCDYTGQQRFPKALGISWSLCIDVSASTIILPNSIGLELDHIHIQNHPNSSSDFNIDINQLTLIRMKANESNQLETLSKQFLEHMSISVNLQLTTEFTTLLNLQLTSLPRIYLSPVRIHWLSQILRTSFSTNQASSSTNFLFRLQSTQMIIIFLTDRSTDMSVLSEALLDQCQMTYELNYTRQRNIRLQFSSFVIKNRLTDADPSLIALTSPSSIEMCLPQIESEYKQLDIRLSKTDVRLIRPTWRFLIELIEFFNHKHEVEEERKANVLSKNNLIKISFAIESISCWLQDEQITLMNIDLQQFTIQFHTFLKQSGSEWFLHSQLGSISVRDLTTIDQIYVERLGTTTNSTTTPVIQFKLTKDRQAQSQLRITSIQYTHTQYFLLRILEYFHRFQQNEDFYKHFMCKIPQKHTGTLWNIEVTDVTLQIPEDLRKQSELTMQLDKIYFNNCSPGYFMSINITNIKLDLSPLIRAPFNLTIATEQNGLSKNYTIKLKLSSIEFLFDSNQLHLLQSILISNLHQQSTSNPSHLFSSIPTSDFALTMELDQIGLEIFLPGTIEHRHSFAYTNLTNLHLSVDKYSDGDQVLHLICSAIKLTDTRAERQDLIVPSSSSSDSHQLELRFKRTKSSNQCTITLNSIRILFVIDWFIEINSFLHTFSRQSSMMANNISFPFSEIQMNLNHFEIVLASTLHDPYTPALIYSSTMMINYLRTRSSVECLIKDLTMITCQVGNINETSLSIIEPTDCSLLIHASNDLPVQYTCELNFSLLNIRISHSDIHMLFSLFQTISRQMQMRKPLLTTVSTFLASPARDYSTLMSDLLNIKFICTEICVCLIDDCFGVNIPLLNVHLKSFQLQTIEHSVQERKEVCDFELTVLYYNRFQSGFEPLIEPCSLLMILMRTSSINFLSVVSKETLNLNFTKAFHCLLNLVQKNWNTKKKAYFRQVKPIEPYCFTNLIGVPIRFRTWISAEQMFSSNEHFVDHNQTIPFSFQIKTRKNSVVTSLFQTDRRVEIAIDGWKCLQPISIDRTGTFFRIATPTDDNYLVQPTLVLIHIAMTENSIRSITIKSSIEVRNQLLNAIDVRCESRSNLVHEFRLESNEMGSLPIQICSMLKHIQVRPADFALGFCTEPISWFEIEHQNLPNSKKKNSRKSSSSEENRINRQSLFRICSFDGKEAVYYLCIQSKQTLLSTFQDEILSVYELSIHPPLTICNLLPCSLTVTIPICHQKIQLDAYKSHREHTLNLLKNIDLFFTTNLYQMNKPFQLPSIHDLHQRKHAHQRISFYDRNQRELFVDVNIVCMIEFRVKLFISVPYILINRSGIPLIFKDSNSKMETAGQTAEDELTLNREPLLFSFDNSNRTDTCVMRVGTCLQRQQDGRSQWSTKFSLQSGSTHRQLQVRSTHRSMDCTYSIAVDSRLGSGYLKKIHFIFFSARYMIHNQCSHDLLIAQRAISHDESNYLKVAQQATAAYHWPRADLEQLLCVQILDEQQRQYVNWSGGFSIDSTNAFHINMRDKMNQCVLLHVQVIERNETYFVVFMDANRMPAPFRISNRSNISIQFQQTDIPLESTHLTTVVAPHQSIDYAWDEPKLKPSLTCSVVDGTKTAYDLLKLGSAEELYYYNYIYLAFQATFEDDNSIATSDSLSCRLVIECEDNRVFLAQCQESKRSQLWYLTADGLLIHIGSTPVNSNGSRKKDLFDDLRQTYVLDIRDLSNTVTKCFTQLTVRRYDPKRLSTQSWQLTDQGYLCLRDNTSMCIQIFGELQTNCDVLLGPTITNPSQLPVPTMYVRSHPRYSGSGVLYACVFADGPTNVLEINSVKSTDASIVTDTISKVLSTIYHVDLQLPAGAGISVVNSMNHESEELIYMFVDHIHIRYNDEGHEQSIEAMIDSLIISNQLLSTSKPRFLYAGFTDSAAIHFEIHWQKLDFNFNHLHIIRSCQIQINSISIQLDELLLWKLIEFFDIKVFSLSSLVYTLTGINNMNTSNRKVGFSIDDYETDRILSLLTSTHATRIYFNELNISGIDLNLSVSCISSKRLLSSSLLAIKRQASFPLVPFENAQIHLKSYEQTHILNTYDLFLLSILTHYIQVCTRQALKILGSVDFLGNPSGFFRDVTDGLGCLTDERGVGESVKNIAHGVADSTSKVTGSLSREIGKLVSNNEPTHHRRNPTTDNNRSATFGQAIRNSTADLAAGFYGGLTSIIKQPYKGAVKDGVPGLMKGFAKGIVGTISKPVVGILDFTNGVATVIKDGARPPNLALQTCLRPTRCPANALGLLQPYNLLDAKGHNLLYKMNSGNSAERYISHCTISTTANETFEKKSTTTSKATSDRVDVMITTQRVIIYRTDDNPDVCSFEIINSYDFDISMTVIPIEDDHGSFYIQFLFDTRTASPKSNALHRCDTLEQAAILSRDVQRAQEIFQENKMLYVASNDEIEDDYNEIFDDQQTD
ncbi:unnamed protein product [Adineta ricciae]|uniref:Uncharacterized protein n=1 Tax=Adineta ricciae TaxID=249248 RepID=A0A814Y642_ADIRI|nr:unnamed protein product [Adineta ricciae]CAF1225878.1 unnamed protein product [Adineta ricciae]